MDGRALAWKWPSALASWTLPCGPCPHDPTGVDSRPSVRPRPCGPRPASSLSRGTVPGVGLISKSLCRRLVFPAATVGGAHGGPSPGPLIVHWTQPNPAPAQGPSRPPPMLQPHRPFAVSPGPGHPFVPLALTMSRLRHRPQVGLLGLPSRPCSGSFGHSPPPLPCELHEDRAVSLVVVQDPQPCGYT